MGKSKDCSCEVRQKVELHKTRSPIHFCFHTSGAWPGCRPRASLFVCLFVLLSLSKLFFVTIKLHMWSTTRRDSENENGVGWKICVHVHFDLLLNSGKPFDPWRERCGRTREDLLSGICIIAKRAPVNLQEPLQRYIFYPCQRRDKGK